MKRSFKRRPIVASDTVIRIPNGEDYNDIALGSRIGEYAYNNLMNQDYESMITEAARYYAEGDFYRSHDFDTIVRTAHEEIEDSMEFENYKRDMVANMPKYTVYSISIGGGYAEPTGDDFTTEDPEQAIEHWFGLETFNPTCAAISAKNKEAAMELLQTAYNNLDHITDLIDAGSFPYNKDYFISSIVDKVEGRRKLSGFYGNSPDQVDPFSLG